MLNCVEVEGREDRVPVVVLADIHPSTHDLDHLRTSNTLLALKTRRKFLPIFVEVILNDYLTIRNEKLNPLAAVLYCILFPRVKFSELIRPNGVQFSLDPQRRREVLDSSGSVGFEGNKLSVPLLPVIIQLLCKCMTHEHRIFDEGILRITALGFIRTEQELELILFKLRIVRSISD